MAIPIVNLFEIIQIEEHDGITAGTFDQQLDSLFSLVPVGHAGDGVLSGRSLSFIQPGLIHGQFGTNL